MKLLVLGNGFDLDHELPTSYLAFLNFCNYALTLENPETPVKNKLTEVQLMYSDILKKNEPIKSTFLSFISQNRLLDYFNKRTEELGENWIDFEHEIDGIIREFKAIETELKSSNSHSYIPNTDHKIHKVMHDLGLGDLDHGPWNEILLATIHSDLCTALNMFSNALEYYISVFINTTPLLGFSPDILSFEANKILTFNYSDTYERWYSGIQWNESIDHVHEWL